MPSNQPVVKKRFEAHKKKISDSIDRHPSFKEELQSCLGNDSRSYDVTVFHSSQILASRNETRTRMFELLKKYGTLKIISGKSEAPEPILFSCESNSVSAYIFRALNDATLRVLCNRLKAIQKNLLRHQATSRFDVSLEKEVKESTPQGLLALSFVFWGREPFICIKTFGVTTEAEFRKLVRSIKEKQIEGALVKWKPALKGENLRIAIDLRRKELEALLMPEREKKNNNVAGRQTTIKVNRVLSKEFQISSQRVRNYVSQSAP